MANAAHRGDRGRPRPMAPGALVRTTGKVTLLIVISGVLVLVALVLLVGGLVFTDGLLLVYGSIAISLVAGVFLLIGVFQRKDEAVANAVTSAPVRAPEPVGGFTVTPPPPPPPRGPPTPPPG